MVVADGFPGQRMLVLPPQVIADAQRSPGTKHLLVTDVGHFPTANRHGFARHRPIDQAVVLLCTHGNGACWTNAGSFKIGPGEAAVLPPGVPHSYAADTEKPWTLWWMHVIGEDLTAILAGANLTERSPVRSVPNIVYAASLIEEILRWMERDVTTAAYLASSGAAWHLLTLLAAGRIPDDHRSHAIDAAAELIRKAPENPLDIDGLAASCHLSRSHFSASFKAQLGVSVLQYRTQLRMSRARELLDTTDLPVSRIAEQVGYTDAYYFTRQFGKIQGVTPTAYRSRTGRQNSM